LPFALPFSLPFLLAAVEDIEARLVRDPYFFLPPLKIFPRDWSDYSLYKTLPSVFFISYNRQISLLPDSFCPGDLFSSVWITCSTQEALAFLPSPSTPPLLPNDDNG